MYSRRQQKQVAKVKVLPAPTGGINDLDPLPNMGEAYSLSLVNWFPNNSALTSRSGYKEWCINLDGVVQTMMTYRDMSGTRALFAATNTNIYDVTAASDAPVAVQETNNGLYKFINFSTVSKTYLICVNGGSDPSLFYDGTDWADFIEKTGPTAPGEIEGVNPNSFSHVMSFKRRLWFVEQDSMTAWYLPIDSLGGVAKPFYLGGVFQRGGNLVYSATWSTETSAGIDNYLVFVSSAGEVAIYEGDDPDNAETWQNVGLAFDGAPSGQRSYADFGGDIIMLNTTGVVPLSAVTKGLMEVTPEEQIFSKRINKTLNRLRRSNLYPNQWDIVNLPQQQAIAVVIPPIGELPGIQYVMNVLTGAWAKWTLPATCIAGNFTNNEIFFGGDGVVYILTGAKDEVKFDGTGGLPVQCDLFTSYNYLDSPGIQKHFKLLRPMFQSSVAPSYLLTLGVDFDIESLAGNPLPPAEGGQVYLWDDAIWDNAFWSAQNLISRPWVGVSAIGFSVALLLKVATVSQTSFVAYELVYEDGGIV